MPRTPAAKKQADATTNDTKKRKRAINPIESKYRVKVRFHSRVVGGIPSDPQVIRDWLKANKIEGEDNEKLALDFESNMTEEDIDEMLRKRTTTFIEDGKGRPCIEARCIKAMLKQTANVAGLYGNLKGFKDLLKEGTEVLPRLIPLAENTDALETEEGITLPKDNYGNVRAAFKRFNYIPGPVDVEFEVHSLNRAGIANMCGKDKSRKETDTLDLNILTQILQAAGKYTGAGAQRSQGEGKFELLSVEDISDPITYV